jgi:hypothetical protein
MFMPVDYHAWIHVNSSTVTIKLVDESQGRPLAHLLLSLLSFIALVLYLALFALRFNR